MNLYRFLLLAFPRHVRRQFGDEMAAMFTSQLEGAHDARAKASLWALAVLDAAVHGLGERTEGLRGRLRTLHPRDWRSPRWRYLMNAIWQDLKYAGRLFTAQRGVTLIAVLTLALGIGANTAIFSAVDALLLRPLPYTEPDQLVMVWEKRPTEGVLDNVVAPADFVDWEKRNAAFVSMAAMTPLTADLTGAGEPERLSGAGVTTAFFDVLKVQPALGRGFVREEGVAGQHRVVVISHELWRDRFASDRGIVGRKVLLNSIPHEVVGVLPDSFSFPDNTIQVWAPIAVEGVSQPLSRASHQFMVYARLKPDVSLADARTDMDRVAAQLSAEYPDTNRTHGAWVSMLADHVREPVRAGLWLLLGAVAFVLLIACVNVANLLLARAAARRREVAVRAAVGASRARIAGQMLTESVVLAGLGGTAGLVVAFWGIRLVRQLSPADVPVLGLDAIALDVRVLAFTFGLSLLTGLLFGTLPAWALAGQDVNDALRGVGRAAGGIKRWWRVGLVVSEIALASLLLVGAGLTWRSFHALLNVEAGINPDKVLTALVTLPGARYRGDERVVTTFDEIHARFAAIPGVRAVGAINLLPLSNMDGRRGVAIEGRTADPDVPTRAHPRSITPGYFEAMGVQLVTGRQFTPADKADAPLVAIVNTTMARRYWPDASPIGRRIAFGGTTEWREVVGVIRDVRHWGFERPVNPEVYLPLAQAPSSSLTFTLATHVSDPGSLAPAVRDRLRSVDPDLPLSNVRTMNEVAARSIDSRATGMRLLAVFGGLALVLAAAGIYGVMTHLVALRSGEIGIRMTLGAKPGDVMRLIVREGFVHASAGLVLGLGAAVLLMNSFRWMLYEVTPADPLTLVAVAALLLGTAMLACIVPARRAMKVDPVAVLRQ
jgi:putative ABC transport system permease protein